MRPTIYWIDEHVPGRLALLPRPRGGDWLEEEVRAWRDAGLEIVVSLLTADEVEELELHKEEALCRVDDLQYVSFPIVDRGVPSSVETTLHLVQKLADWLAEGKAIGIHCRSCIGRSPLIAACVLAFFGTDTEAALQRISAARGCPVPETTEQRDWLTKFAERATMIAAKNLR